MSYVIFAGANSKKTQHAAYYTRCGWETYLNRSAINGSYSQTMFPGTNNTLYATSLMLAIASYQGDSRITDGSDWDHTKGSRLKDVIFNLSDANHHDKVSTLLGLTQPSTGSQSSLSQKLNQLSANMASGNLNHGMVSCTADSEHKADYCPNQGFALIIKDSTFLSVNTNEQQCDYIVIFGIDYPTPLVSSDNLIKSLLELSHEMVKSKKLSGADFYYYLEDEWVKYCTISISESVRIFKQNVQGYDTDRGLCHDVTGEGGKQPIQYFKEWEGNKLLRSDTVIIPTANGLMDLRIPPVTVPFTNSPGFIDSFTPYIGVLIAIFSGTTLAGGKATQLNHFFNLKNASSKILLYSPDTIDNDPFYQSGRDFARDLSGVLRCVKASKRRRVDARDYIAKDIQKLTSRDRRGDDFSFDLDNIALYCTRRFRDDRQTWNLIANENVVVGSNYYLVRAENEYFGKDRDIVNMTPLAFIFHPLPITEKENAEFLKVSKDPLRRKDTENLSAFSSDYSESIMESKRFSPGKPVNLDVIQDELRNLFSVDQIDATKED